MITLDANEFDIEKIAKSGQCFRIRQLESGIWIIPSKDKILFAMEKGESLYLDCSEADFKAYWADYFDISTDYSKIRKKVKKDDKFLTEAARFSKGIRILKQDKWEMLISFIISQQNSIPKISKTVEKISSIWGTPVEAAPSKKLTGKEIKEEVFYSFPTPGQLGKASLDDLKACSLGYRADYIFKATKGVLDGTIDLEKIDTLSDEDLLKELMEIRGVGIKVANCVSLFGYHRVNAFPIDVWIRRIIDEQYQGNFDPNQYAPYAGIIQQFMFFYGRSL